MLAKPRSHPEAKRTRLAIFDSQEPGVIGWLCKCAIFYLDYVLLAGTGKLNARRRRCLKPVHLILERMFILGQHR
jgi:hypothetical protein